MKTVDKDFFHLIRDVIRTEEFIQMKNYRHHVNKTTYEHSIKVAYLCYRHHKLFGMKKTTMNELVRGALLHDFYLYNHHERDAFRGHHGIVHPRHALKNALDLYPDLSRVERDMIRRHMFPLTITPPKTAGGWLVCLYDKIAAVSDFCSKRKINTNV